MSERDPKLIYLSDHVATAFGKEHRTVRGAIDRISPLCPSHFYAMQKPTGGRPLRCYGMSSEGLAMLTGAIGNLSEEAYKKALETKIAPLPRNKQKKNANLQNVLNKIKESDTEIEVETDSYILTEAAKELGILRKDLIAWLTNQEMIFQRSYKSGIRWTAYQSSIDNGHLRNSRIYWKYDPKESKVIQANIEQQLRITSKGLEYIRTKLGIKPRLVASNM